MAEMALTADHLVVIGRGCLLADTTVDDLVQQSGGSSVKVVTPHAPDLRRTLLAEHPHTRITTLAPDTLEVHGTDGPHIGRTAAAHAIPLHELTPQNASLEQAFMRLTQDAVEYQGAPA